MSKYPPLGLGDIIKFGKHKGTEMSDLIMNHTSYVKYMTDEKIIELTNEAYELFKEHNE